MTSCYDYEQAWKTVTAYLTLHEPSLRYFSLQCISLVSKSIARTLIRQDLRRELVSLLTKLVTGDEQWNNRCLAARLLGELVDVMSDSHFPSRLRKAAFEAVLGQLLDVFPQALGDSLQHDPTMFDALHYVTPQKFRRRVQMLDACGYFLSCAEASTAQTMGYLDRLLSSLLRHKVHHFLQASAIRAIHAHLPVTNRNRLRVERFFRTALQTLSDSGLSTEGGGQSDGTVTVPSVQDASPDGPTLHPLVKREIAKFWSVWFPRPDDVQLKQIACTSDHLSRVNGGGYASRRWAWLSLDSYRRSGKSPSEMYKADPRRTVARRRTVDPYNVGAFDAAAVQLRLFETAVAAEKHAEVSAADLVQKENEDSAAEVEEEDDPSIDASTLTFNMNPPVLLFNRYPFHKEIFLQNKSMTHDVPFRLQTGPSQFFNASPAFGVLPKGESVTVTVTFTSCPHVVKKSPEVAGFLRVRAASGLPFERITLRGYNMPAIKITPLSLNFGICPVGDSRTMVFMATNLLPIDCPIVMLVVPSSTSSMFQIYPTQTILNPKEKKPFMIKFVPTANGDIFDQLLVVAFGGEISKIGLEGVAGQALHILDTKLDFGPTDIYYNSVVKKMTIRNRDTVPMPVHHVASTAEIVVNHGKPLLLRALEERKISVTFLSAFTGARQESLTFHAPHSMPVPLEVLAFSGPAVWVPVNDRIVFPTATASHPVTVQLPIVNLSSAATQFTISGPPGTPFSIRLADPETANRKLPNGAALQVESRPYEGPDMIGVSVLLGPRLTVVLKVTFLSPNHGTYRTSLSIVMSKPRKWPVTTLHLFAIAVNETYLARERPIDALRRFMLNPSTEPSTGVIAKKQMEVPSEPLDPFKTSEIFELEPPLQVVFGAHLSGRFEDICESVTLTNMTSVTQKFRLAISEHFYTDLPLDGELEGMASMDVPVRLDASFLDDLGDPEAKHRVIMGSVTVFDHDDRKLGMVSSGLHGVVGDLLSLEARDDVSSSLFPPLKIMEKHTRRFFLRNRAPFDVVWEGRMVSVGQSGTGLQADGLPLIVPTGASTSEWCPFGLSVPRVSLKPHEFYTVDVTFQATSSGDYKAKLFMEYLDPVMHIVNSEHMRGKSKRAIRQLTFSCAVGTEDMTTMPDFLVHGDVEIGNQTSKALTIINNQPLTSRMSVIISPPFRTVATTIEMRKQSKVDLHTLFEPTKSANHSDLLVIAFAGKTRTVPILGTGGRSGLGSNVASPVRIAAPEVVTDLGDLRGTDVTDHTIDFGFVELGHPKDKPFSIVNTGTFDYTVKSIVLGDEQYLAWKFVEDVAGDNVIPQMGLVDFATVVMDASEVDWDEIDHKAAEQGGAGAGYGRQSVVSSTNTAPRRRRYKSISQSTTGPSTLSKAFPFRLPPSQEVGVNLMFSGFEKGDHETTIKVDLERSNGELESYVFWVHGNLQPALQLWEKRIEFGIRAVHMRHKCMKRLGLNFIAGFDVMQKADLKFTNTGSVPLSWNLTRDSIKYTGIERFDPLPLPKDEKSIPPPIALFPLSGRLLPGCTQSVAVAFTPSLAQYDMNTYWTLKTEHFAETQVVVHGVGASSRLTVDVAELDFGIIRVGTRKSFRLSVRNRGILPLKYFVECSNTQFSADPEQGLLEGAGAVDIVVKFVPKAVGQLNEFLRILPHPQAGYSLDPIVVGLKGMGSYPELVVLTRMVDFGTALFMTRNVQPVTVQNKGSAEAHIVFSCHHPGISLDDKDSFEVVLEPHTTKDINIVYVPQVVETLKVKAFLRSSDSRGDHFIIALKGSVGVPKLAFDPPDILETLDFGVCAVNGVFKKVFTMTNEGNISLPYILSLDNKTATPHDPENNTVFKPVPPKAGVISIQPTEGALAVGESVQITLTFVPDMLAEYDCHLNLNYEFRSSSAPVKGVGGRAILRIDSPLSLIDFGTCRLNRVFRKPLTISNAGNLGVDYHLRPEPASGDWSIYDLGKDGVVTTDVVVPGDEPPATQPWVKQLSQKGFALLNPDGYCTPHGKTDLLIEFSPSTESLVEVRLRVYFGDQFEDIQICGRAAVPRLTLYGASNEFLAGAGDMRTLDLGVHPVNSEHMHSLQLKNEGPFGVDYLVQPFSMPEFDVQPLRGFILPGASSPLRVYFRPSSETRCQTAMKILWEKEPLRLQMEASGGIGKLEIVYADEKDTSINGLDFGMVPFNSSSEKHFFLYNVGMVEISMEATVDNDEYVIASIGEPIPHHQPQDRPTAVAPKPPSPSKRTIWNWYSNLRATIPPGTGVEIISRFVARSPTVSAGNIQIRSEGGSFIVPMRGKGGTIQITHRGDLNMGDIATNYVYRRKVVIVNSGSIPASLTAEWLVVGHSSEPSSAFIQLNDNFSTLDPRSGWARQQLCADNGVTEMVLTAKDRWQLIALMIKKVEMLEEVPVAGGDPLSKLWGSTLGRLRSLLKDQRAPAGESGGATPLAQGSAASSISNIAGGGRPGAVGSQGILATKKPLPAQLSAHFKRRQMFFHLISNTQHTSQSASDVKPYLRVEPPVCLLPSYGEVTLNVEIDLATEDTFLATLVVRPSIPNTPVHEIALTATPKIVNIVCDDTRMLNFHRQPLGESEFIMRTFTNVGHKDINYHFTNTNASLRIAPSRGAMRVGQTITVRFTFEPTDEAIQNADVIFLPDISQPIRFKMYGGGGFTKVSLSRYRRFDFGHCMIGKDTVSFLPVNNEGNAVLHLNRFELHETDTFFKGMDWPTSRISLFPGQTFNLPIVFNPHEESPAPGRLVVGTAAESWEIELIGLGREAVLIVSKVALEFSECLIGNSYEQKLGLKNVGDVNYPVTFKLEREFPDIEFLPASLVIHPFSESEVIIAYTPSRETKSTVVLTVSSPYSTHKVPLLLHAGTAILEFDAEELDFGMFERTTTPVVRLSIQNVGTVRTSYAVRDTVRPSMFSIGHSKGVLQPGRTTTVTVSHVRHEVAQFEERLVIRTDLIDKLYHVTVKGQCEEALLRPDEFNVCNMGICPVLENTTRPISFTNYGRYPLDFSVKSSYPLKVSPATGTVLGGQSSSFAVTWNPSGGYELRTHIAVVTNIGTFNVQIRGKAAFPELVIKNMYLDFGVCAVGHLYREVFNLTNKGKVPVHFSIPPSREASYFLGTSNGTLEPKESLDVEAFFKPATVGKFAHTFMVECKGINYKEVVVVGIGGVMKLEFSPASLDLGRCPCELRVFHSIQLINKGEVILFVNFKRGEEEVGAEEDCRIALPDSLVLRPGRSTRCFFGVTIGRVGSFTAKILVCTKEKTHTVYLSGTGIKIVLDPRSRTILDTEHLSSLPVPGPFGTEIRFGDVEDWIRRFSRRYRLDGMISEWLISLYLAARGVTRIEDMLPVFEQAKGLFTQVAPDAALPPLPPLPPSPGNEIVKETQGGAQEEQVAPRSLPSFQQRPLGPIPKDAFHIPGPAPPAAQVEATLPSTPSVVVVDEEEAPRKETEFMSGMPGDRYPDSLIRPYEPAMFQDSLSPEDVRLGPSGVPAAPVTNVVLEKRMDLLRAVEDIRLAATAPQVAVVNALVDTFIELKKEDVKATAPIPTDDEDAIISSVLRYPIIEITQYDLDPILCEDEPTLDLDLDFLLARPPPFRKEEKLTTEVREEPRTDQSVWRTWTPLERRKRNAKTVDAYR
ncbi:hypothetical protein HKX48_003248 [Thoreauomyces humboldtii]|nr:hypothetical protein HKX48_003248 [Thoreauomyces humboldtii]